MINRSLSIFTILSLLSFSLIAQEQEVQQEQEKETEVEKVEEKELTFEEKVLDAKKKALENLIELQGNTEGTARSVVNQEVARAFDEEKKVIEESKMNENAKFEEMAKIKHEEEFFDLVDLFINNAGSRELDTVDLVRIELKLKNLIHREESLTNLKKLARTLDRYIEKQEKLKHENNSPKLNQLVGIILNEIKTREEKGEIAKKPTTKLEKRLSVLFSLKSLHGVCPTRKTLEYYLNEELKIINLNMKIEKTVKAIMESDLGDEDKEEKLKDFRSLEEIKNDLELSIANIDLLTKSCSMKIEAEKDIDELVNSNREGFKESDFEKNSLDIGKDLVESYKSFNGYRARVKENAKQD